MESDKFILDNPEKIEVPVEAFKSRVPRDLLIVIGVIFSILGIYFLYVFVEALGNISEELKRSEVRVNNHYHLKMMVANFLSLFYGTALIIGGFGLIRLRKFGWMFGLAVAAYPIFLVLIGTIRTFMNDARIWPGLIWIAFFVVVFFGLITTFLLSKPIRNYFKPSKNEYGFSAFIVILLVFYLLAIPLMF